jgi:hypothetical protein
LFCASSPSAPSLSISSVFPSPASPRWRAQPARPPGCSGLVARTSFPNNAASLAPAPGQLAQSCTRLNIEPSQILLGVSPQNPSSIALKPVAHTATDPPPISPTNSPYPQTLLCDSCHSKQHGLSSAWESSTASSSPVWQSSFRSWIALPM